MKKKLCFVATLLTLCTVVGLLHPKEASAQLPDPNSLSFKKVSNPFPDANPGQLMSIWPGGHFYGNGIDNWRSSFEFGTNLNVSWEHFEYSKIYLSIDGELDPRTNYPYPAIFYNSRSYAAEPDKRAEDGLIEVNLYIRKDTGNGYEYGVKSFRKELFDDNRVTFFKEKKYRGQIVVEKVQTLKDANRIEIDLGDYLKDNDLAISIPWVETSLSSEPYTYPCDKKQIKSTFTSRFELFYNDGTYRNTPLYRDGYYYK